MILVQQFEGDFEDFGIHGRIIMKWTLKKSVGWTWTGLLEIRIWTSRRHL